MGKSDFRFYYGIRSTEDEKAVQTFQTQWFTEG